MRASTGVLIACALLSTRADAQRVASLRTGAEPTGSHAHESSSARTGGPTPGTFFMSLRRIPAPLAPLASAALPGSGQAMLRQDRFLAYLAVEAFVWLQYAKDSRESAAQERQSVNLALQVARAPFVNPATAPAGNWDYYETLEHYVESGKYSLVSGAVVPDTTPQTYNAYIWNLARLNHWANPNRPPPQGSAEYQAALDEYSRRAAKPGFQWSWRDHQLEQDLYRESINHRNDAARRATFDLAIVMANHVLSMVDAFATWRIQSLEGSAPGARLTIPMLRF